MKSESEAEAGRRWTLQPKAMQTGRQTTICDPNETLGVEVMAERGVRAEKSLLPSCSWTSLGGSTGPWHWHTSKEQAFGMILTQPGTSWDQTPALCPIWEKCKLRLVL